jgi:hypothetical protein
VTWRLFSGCGLVIAWELIYPRMNISWYIWVLALLERSKNIGHNL